MNLDAIRANAAAAETEDLLDRVTIYRAGMTEPALEVLEQELQARGVTADRVRGHAEERSQEVLWQRPGLAWSCAFCDKPAVCCRRQRRFWGMLPLFPRQVRCCREHLK